MSDLANPAATADSVRAPGAGFFAPLILVIVGVAVYATSLGGAFVYDDSSAIQKNESIRQLWPPGPMLSPPPQTPVGGRPVVNATFALNHAIGALEPRGYHVVNILVHVATALALFGVVRRTLAARPLVARFGASSRGLALTAALLWAVHPLASEPVLYLTQRTESIMALFYLLTLYCAIRADEGRGLPWSIAAVACCALGMASKEVMVTAPVMVVLYDVAYRRDTVRDVLGRRWPLYAGLAATWIVLALLNWSAPRSATVGMDVGTGVMTYAWNQCLMVTQYVRLAFWPAPLTVDYGFPGALSFGDVLPQALFVLALVMLAWVAYVVRPRAGFPLVWMLLILAPTSTFVPISTEVGAEKRMYLPLAGLVALVVVGAAALLPGIVRGIARGTARADAARVESAIGGVVVVGLAVALALATVRRSLDYVSELAIWESAVAVVPDNPRARNNLANALDAAGRVDEAVVHYQEAVRRRDELGQRADVTARGIYNLGRGLHIQGRLPEAIAQYQRALALSPDANMHSNLAQALVSRAEKQTVAEARRAEMLVAIDHFRAAITLNPRFANAYYHLGRALLAIEELDESIARLQNAVALAPDDVDIRYQLAQTLAAKTLYAEALPHYERAAELAPDRANVAYGLGYAQMVTNQLDAAATSFRAATRLDPQLAEAHNNLGTIRAQQGRMDAAIRRFQRAITANPEYAAAHNNLGAALIAQGRVPEAIEWFRRAVALDPADAGAGENLARASIASGQFDEALPILEDLMDRYERRPAAFVMMTRVLLDHPDPALRDPERALALARRAVGLTDDNDLSAMTAVADAYEANGKRDLAIKATEAALRLAEAVDRQAIAARLRADLARYRGGG